jgi:predicted nucleic acid-binding protein
MNPVLVDSCVILDVVTDDPVWGQWSDETLETLANDTELVVNALIYAEVSVGLDTIEAVDAAIPIDAYRREPLPYEAAFLAGKAFVEYRRRGGERRSPLADFYIGAHAAVMGYKLLTRDEARFRSYFPNLELITPPQSNGR